MTDICLVFEVHQPFRLNRNFHLDLITSLRTEKQDLFKLYFDRKINKEIFDRISRECYLPANEIILNQIDESKKGKKRFKVAYSLSGVFIEQCEMWNQDVIESFKQLAESGCVEFLDQTYYHSLASLFNSDSEFIDQIKLHREMMQTLLHYKPKVFENTECIYDNTIAKITEKLGYRAIVTEGIERILGWRAPNYVYKAKNSSIRVLLRNYQLSDDVGFRFTSRGWDQWPVTADKYANWLAASPGQVINIFMDYETFGEHYRRESGIFDFLKWLPIEITRRDHLFFYTPSEVIRRHEPVDEIDVPENEATSWADTERDTSAWLGNSLQRISFSRLKELEPFAREMGNKELLRMWRYLQISDQLYYMSTKGGGPGDVHSTFNPYDSPAEAFITYIEILSDLQSRFQIELEKPEFRHMRILRRLPKEKGFTFFHEFARPTWLTACSLREFHSILQTVDADLIKFHMSRGDFERWLAHVVGDDELAREVLALPKMSNGELLRRELLDRIEKRIRDLEESSV